MVNSTNIEALACESVWYEKCRYEDAERKFHEQLAKVRWAIYVLLGYRNPIWC